MKTQSPIALPYSNIHVEHKKPRKEKVVPVKHDTEQRRCSKFYCVETKSNKCCKFCLLYCENRCMNEIPHCGLLTDEIHGKSTLTVLGGG